MAEEYLRIVRDTTLSVRPGPSATRLVEVKRGTIIRLIDRHDDRHDDREFYKVAYQDQHYYLRKQDAVDYHGDAAAGEFDADTADLTELENEGDNISFELSDVARRYTALQTISSLLRYGGWIILVLGSIGSVLAGLGLWSDTDTAPFALLVIIGGLLYSWAAGLIFLAGADILLLLVDVERNTRVIAVAMIQNEEES